MKGVGFLRSILAALPDMSAGSALRYAQMMRGKGGDMVRICPRRYPGLALVIRSRGSDRWTFREIFVKEVYRAVAEQLSSCRRFVDLGANIGLASLYFARKFPDSEFLSVEACPATYDVLSRNLRPLEEDGRATTVCGAVWSHDGYVLADDKGSPEGYSRFGVKAVRPGHVSAQGKIKARCLDTLLNDQGWDTVDLIKIDVEGAEVELFKANPDWLHRTRCLAIEFHDASAQQCNWPAVLDRYGMREQPSGDSHTAIGMRGFMDAAE